MVTLKYSVRRNSVMILRISRKEILFCGKVSLALLGFMTMILLDHLRYQRVEIELQVVHTEVLSKATLNSLSELPQILSKVRCSLIHS